MTEPQGYSDAALRAASEASQARAAITASEERAARQLELSIQAVKEFGQTGLGEQWKQAELAHEAFDRRLSDLRTTLLARIDEVDRQAEFRDSQAQQDAERQSTQLRLAAEQRADQLATTTALWHAAHMQSHATSKTADESALVERVRANNANIEQWRLAHQQAHDREREAVQVALGEVSRLSDLHAVAHSAQHVAHEEIHNRERAAGEKAENRLDQRLEEMNHIRMAAKETRDTFITRDVLDAKIVTLESRIGAGDKDQAQTAQTLVQMRGSLVTREILDEKVNSVTVTMRDAERASLARIEALEKSSVGDERASQQTRYLFATLLTVLAAALGLFAILH